MKLIHVLVAVILTAIAFGIQAAPASASNQPLRCLGTKDACDKLKGTVSPTDIGGPADIKKKKTY